MCRFPEDNGLRVLCDLAIVTLVACELGTNWHRIASAKTRVAAEFKGYAIAVIVVLLAWCLAVLTLKLLRLVRRRSSHHATSGLAGFADWVLTVVDGTAVAKHPSGRNKFVVSRFDAERGAIRRFCMVGVAADADATMLREYFEGAVVRAQDDLKQWNVRQCQQPVAIGSNRVTKFVICA